MTVDIRALRRLVHGVAEPAAAKPEPTGRLIDLTTRRLRLFGRNGIAYLASRAWRSEAKAIGIAALRAEKANPNSMLIESAAVEIAEDVIAVFGPPGFTVASVACGHSRCADCWGWKLANASSIALGAPYSKLFKDRFSAGTSHPKEHDGLPPLEWQEKPAGPVLVVDDVATSGWHLEEAMTRIRAEGYPAAAIAWIAGVTSK